MKSTNESAELFGEFPPVSTADWEAKIHEDLKGADYDKKLIWKTAEGFSVKPYYRSEDLTNLESFADALPGQFPFIRGNKSTGNNWRICQEIEAIDPKTANTLAKEVIARGADAIRVNAGKVKSAESLRELLESVDVLKASLNFHSSESYTELAKLLISYLGDKAGKTCGSFDFDPIGYLLLHGNFHPSTKDLSEAVSELVANYSDKLPYFRLITVNGQNFHNAGSTLTQELAFALATGNEYLAMLTEKGVSIDKAAQSILFTFATGSNYFMEIAKLRAARLLWAKIVEQYNPASTESGKMHIHSVTANWNKTLYDPYVNMLRTTTESMSAVLGGADMITVLPFDNFYKEPDTFSMRIARNQQIILKEESSLDKVIDPASGSYYIENLTASLADAAWKLFLEVEDKGGMIAAIKAGFIQDSVAESAKQKNAEIASRRTIMLGTNQYPNLIENMLEKIQTSEDQDEDQALRAAPIYKVMELYRVAEAFEDVRLATEIYVSDGGERPHVFLLTMGNLAMRKARAGFSTNFFGCAGYKVTDNPGFATVEEGAKAALDAKANVVVICSSDEEYAEIAPELTRILKAANPDIQVVVAGYPKEILDSLKEAGVDEFIHVRTNVLDTLYAFQQKLGVML